MSKIEWSDVWLAALGDKELFPIKSINSKTVSISCPTRFSNKGAFSIDVTPTFNKSSIVLELLVFNDNIQLSDIDLSTSDDSKDDFNLLSSKLVEFELSNRLFDRFTIKSNGFEDNDEAKEALIDYLNNKATESGRMFDDKLDELNDVISNKNEKRTRIVESIKRARYTVFSKIESILKSNYGWHTHKNEDLTDTTASFYDTDGQLAAVVSLVDNCILVDLAEGVTSKISMLQSDEEIESEMVDDINNAKEILSDEELSSIKDVVADDNTDYRDPVTSDYLDELEKKITRLESIYINRRLHNRLY